jgi:hypothetical protein
MDTEGELGGTAKTLTNVTDDRVLVASDTYTVMRAVEFREEVALAVTDRVEAEEGVALSTAVRGQMGEYNGEI